MQSKGASYCQRCGFVIMGSFAGCIKCGARHMFYYADPFHPDLLAIVRRLKGQREPANFMTSLLVVAVVTGLFSFVYWLAITGNVNIPTPWAGNCLTALSNSILLK